MLFSGTTLRVVKGSEGFDTIATYTCQEDVLAAAVSPDGATVAIATEHLDIQLLQLPDLTNAVTLWEGADLIRSLGFSASDEL